jgi:cell division protein FtsL
VTVVTVLVVGLVSLNALRVDAAYETRSVTERVGLLTDEREALVNDVARLSSPSRIGTWARAEGLVHPAAGDVVILQVPGTAAGTASAAGAGA